VTAHIGSHCLRLLTTLGLRLLLGGPTQPARPIPRALQLLNRLLQRCPLRANAHIDPAVAISAWRVPNKGYEADLRARSDRMTQEPGIAS
jgi:hypothetical protein